MSLLWPTYIEPGLALEKAERKAVHRDAWRLWYRNRWNLVIYVAFVIAAVPFMLIIRDLAGWLAGMVTIGGLGFRVSRAMAIVVSYVVWFVFGGVLLLRWRFAPCVYRSLRSHGHDVCPRCGYWLRGLESDPAHCPECGKQRDSPPRPKPE